jgi:defect-in-organelle-trafficking protein DotC
MRRDGWRLATLLLAVLCLSTPLCATTLQQLQGAKGSASRDEALAQSEARALTLREAALAAGSQNGFSERANALQASLRRYGDVLDSVFRFDLVLEENGRLLPPSIATTETERDLESKNRLLETGRVWRITHAAELVLAAPTWRDYLLSISVATPDKVMATSLPRSNDERAVWAQAVAEGWALGESQADQVFAQQFQEMSTRYIGILRFRALRAMGVISQPDVARSVESIVVTPDSVRIDQQAIEIMERAEFQAASAWKAIVTKR